MSEIKPMNPSTKQQLQILTFADAGWEIERRHVTIINWTVCPKDKPFDFAAYEYRVVLPPLPEGYEVVELGTEIKAGDRYIWLNTVRKEWKESTQALSDFQVQSTDQVYAVKRQPTTKMSSKTIDELWTEWQAANQWSTQSKAYRAGHLQGCKDSLELLKRAYDACSDNRDNPDDPTLCMELEDQIGYIEEQLHQKSTIDI